MSERYEGERYNLFRMAEKTMLNEASEAMLESIMSQLVEDFRRRAEPVVKEELKKLSVLSVKHVSDLAGLREEFHVYCSWIDEQEITRKARAS